MLPELPAASYSVWVRGYGLVDSKPVQTKPTATAVTLRVNAGADAAGGRQGLSRQLLAVDARAAAAQRVPRHRPAGQRHRRRHADAGHWINSLKSDCNFCHQLGNQLTRTVDHVFKAKPELKTHAEAWEWRLGPGVRGSNSMYGVLNNRAGSAR